MIYSIEKIIRDARVANGLEAMQPPMEGCMQYALTADEMITARVEEATRQAILEAEPFQLDAGHNFDADENAEAGGIEWEEIAEGAYCGRMILPADFLRLVMYRMADWERAVYQPISADSALYAQQRSRYAGLRGSPQRPICAIGMSATGRILEFFTCGQADTPIKAAIYVPEPKIDAYGGIEIPERIYPRVIEKIDLRH